MKTWSQTKGKLKFEHMGISPDFKGQVCLMGQIQLTITGDFGPQKKELIYWKNPVIIGKGQKLEIYVEHQREASLELYLVIHSVRNDEEIVRDICIPLKEMGQTVTYMQEEADGELFLSLQAKGSGMLAFRTLHYRIKEEGFTFLPGDQRICSNLGEELFVCFKEGNGKAPLTVYFCDYNEEEGFAGTELMEGCENPCLMIADTRIKGGAFYLNRAGEEDNLEELITDYIEGVRNKLGFLENQVLMTGISMGAYGALYYGARLHPQSLVLGKPICNLGQVAINERLLHPGIFPEALDILEYLAGGKEPKLCQELDQKMWKKIDYGFWNQTRCYVYYMVEDDFDPDGFGQLQANLRGKAKEFWGCGIQGRHTDEEKLISKRLKGELERILAEDFAISPSTKEGR